MKCKLFSSYIKKLILILTIINFNSALGQTPGVWESFGPSDGLISVQNIIVNPVNPQLMFMMSGSFFQGDRLVSGKIYQSSDFGLTWRQADPPFDQSLNKMILINGGLFAVSNNGVFMSPDGGFSWTRPNWSINTNSVTDLFLIDNILFAATNDDGLFRSIDGGLSWIQANPPMNGKKVYRLMRTSSALIAVTSPSFQGIYRSIDGGIDWTEITVPTNDTNFINVLALNDTLYVGTPFQGVFHSIDNGSTWIQGSLPLDFDPVYYDISMLRMFIVKGEVFGAFVARDEETQEAYYDFYRSRNGGLTWTGVLSNVNVNVLASFEGVLYAGTTRRFVNLRTDFFGVTDGMFISEDQGKTWGQATPPLNDKDISTINFVNGTIFVGTNRNSLFRSFDNARTWFSTNNSNLISTLSCNKLVVNRNFILTNTIQFAGGRIFHSSDGGVEWNWVLGFAPEGLEDGDLNAMILAEDRLYASIDGYLIRGVDEGDSYFNAAKVYFSTDWGVSWQETTSQFHENVNTFYALNGTLYAGTDAYGVFRSTNGGVNWTQANTPMNDKSVTTLLSMGGILYAGTGGFTGQGVFYSIDQGINWTQANSPMNDKLVTTLISANGRLYAGTGGFSQSEHQGVFYSLDNGINWTHSNAPMNDKWVTTLLSVDGILYAGTSGLSQNDNQGVFYSSDEGITWTQAKAPMNDKRVITLFSLSGILYAGTSDGVFRSLDKGINWTPFVAGLGKTSVNEIAYLPELNRLYAATENGVYFQILDTNPPSAVSMTINNAASFTMDPEASLILFADEADSMTVSEDITFSNASWQAYQVNPNFTLSISDGPKTIYAKFKDLSWNESPVISAQIFLDTTPPSFLSHTSPSSAAVGQLVSINQQVNEPNLQSIELYFHRAGEPWSENRKVAFQGTSAEIDGAFITNRGIDYRIIAKDFAGQSDTLRNGSLDFFSIPVNLAVDQAGSSPGLPAGFGGAAYRIVSVPMKLSGSPNVQSMFGDFGPYGTNGDWRFWTYQGNNNWQEGDNLAIENARGYFLILRNGGTLTNKVAGTTMETTAGVVGNISNWQLRANDWTIIGNPYNARIELGQLKLANRGARLHEQVTGLQVWAYDGSSTNKGWTNDNIALQAWSGLAVFSQEADQIVFANTSDPFAPVLGKPSPPPDPLVVNASRGVGGADQSPD